MNQKISEVDKKQNKNYHILSEKYVGYKVNFHIENPGAIKYCVMYYR